MKSTWRLLQTPAAHGAWNMAADEAILEAVGRGAAPATLRLYSWEPACLSLGYAQPSAEIDLPRLREHGWEMVRRATGGRAVLHTDELTYSVIAPLDEPRVAGSVLESYQRLAGALVEALRLLGLPVEVHEGAPASNKSPNPVCFEVPSSYEITVGGKKLVGSAQRRSRDGILQHGSLPLYGDLTRILQALVYPDQEKRQNAAVRLLERATTVEAVLGRVVSVEEAAGAYVRAFESVLELELRPGGLSREEEEAAGRLAREKYIRIDWNHA
jgi:lipoate-protein ligase A